MKYLRHFYRFAEILVLDDRLRPQRLIKRIGSSRPPLAPGYFIDVPELMFVTGSPAGPVMGLRGRIYPISAETRMRLRGMDDRRILAITLDNNVTLVVPAPGGELSAVELSGEAGVRDFFVWLERRVPMPQIWRSLTDPA